MSATGGTSASARSSGQGGLRKPEIEQQGRCAQGAELTQASHPRHEPDRGRFQPKGPVHLDGGDGHADRVCQQHEVGDVLRARLLGGARGWVHEEVDACPAVRRLPKEIWYEQQHGEGERHRESGGTEHDAAPDQEADRDQHQNDGKRVLGLEADAGGDAKRPPRGPPERETKSQPEHDHRRQLVERDRLEEPVRCNQQRREADGDSGQRLRAFIASELARD